MSQIQKDIFKIEFNDEIKFLPIKDIQYFSTSLGAPHKLEVHLTHAQLQFYEKIKEMRKCIGILSVVINPMLSIHKMCGRLIKKPEKSRWQTARPSQPLSVD